METTKRLTSVQMKVLANHTNEGVCGNARTLKSLRAAGMIWARPSGSHHLSLNGAKLLKLSGLPVRDAECALQV